MILAAYVGIELIPIALTRQEALRVLDEHSNQYARQASGDLDGNKAKTIRSQAYAALNRIGVEDPSLEV